MDNIEDDTAGSINAAFCGRVTKRPGTNMNVRSDELGADNLTFDGHDTDRTEPDMRGLGDNIMENNLPFKAEVTGLMLQSNGCSTTADEVHSPGKGSEGDGKSSPQAKDTFLSSASLVPRRQCRSVNASWFSWCTMGWLTPMILHGFKHGLTEQDMCEVRPQDKSETVTEKLERNWKVELQKKSPSLFRCLAKTHAFPLIGLCFTAVSCEASRIIQSIAVLQVVVYLRSTGSVSERDAWIWTASIALMAFLLLLSWCIHNMWTELWSQEMRTSLSAMILKKALQLNNVTFMQTTSGSIVNLISTDVEKFRLAGLVSHFALCAPIDLTAVSLLLYFNLGVAAAPGIALLVIIPLGQTLCSMVFGKLRAKVCLWGDQRVALMNEIITGMRVIKMYCWEQPYAKAIASLRKKELRYISYMLQYIGSITASYHMSCKLCGFVILLVVGLTTDNLSVSTVVQVIAWTEILRLPVFMFWPLAFAVDAELHVSVSRIQNFLLLNDIRDTKVAAVNDALECACDPNTQDGSDLVLRMTRVHASWGKIPHAAEGDLKDSDKDFGLNDINLEAKKGELVAVVGEVGGGKSSILMTILGELPRSSGDIFVNGSIAYVPQEAWIYSGTVRENILFGKPMDPDRYRNVVDVCSLIPDLNIMPSSDLTLVGERGMSLSGGQKTRINLARALYNSADLYLLDDPLSSVDAKVGKHIFSRCIRGCLGDACVILVTHQLAFLPYVDKIVVVEQGRVIEIGTYEELQQKLDLTAVVRKEKNEVPETATRRIRTGSERTEPTDITFTEDILGEDQGAEEDEISGTISRQVFCDYFRAGNMWFYIPAITLATVAYEVFYFYYDWWMLQWAIKNEAYVANINATAPLQVTTDATVAGVMILLVLLLNFISIKLTLEFLLRSSKNLHNDMFARLLRAPLSFFERTPVGTVLNHFSRDTHFMDTFLPDAYVVTGRLFMMVLGVFILVCVSLPWLVLAVIPAMIGPVILRFLALPACRDLRRLEARYRSPVFSHISATLQGLHVVRAFKKEHLFVEYFHNVQDLHTSAWLHEVMSFRWLGTRVDLLVASLITVTAITAMALQNEVVDSGLLGLALSYLIILLGALQYGVHKSSEVEAMMTSVERIQNYTRLPQEAPPHVAGCPPQDWPAHGDIVIKNMSLRYSDAAAPAIQTLSLHIQDKEKIGVVGRTGAGKSSLVASLLRLVEPTGTVLIDGVDVGKIGLDDLRSNISVIPQDPVLFSGTIRRNLDPFEEYSDEEIWIVLDQVQLRDKIVGMEGCLNAETSEAGGNFSVGQRQLVCLARALLRKNKILMIDEATANVDQWTDTLIQKTLREKFLDSTVITIAHRLNTVIDYDRIMVMDMGQLNQIGTPLELLLDLEGTFYQMASHLGEEALQALIREARGNQLATRGPATTGNRDYDANEANYSVSPTIQGSGAIVNNHLEGFVTKL